MSAVILRLADHRPAPPPPPIHDSLVCAVATRFAPGMKQIGPDDPRAWRKWIDKDLVSILADALTQLQRTPDEISVKTLASGWPALMGRAEGFRAVPLMMFSLGLEEGPIGRALEAMQAAGWRPELAS